MDLGSLAMCGILFPCNSTFTMAFLQWSTYDIWPGQVAPCRVKCGFLVSDFTIYMLILLPSQCIHLMCL